VEGSASSEPGGDEAPPSSWFITSGFDDKWRATMILDTLDNAAKYAGLKDGLAEAFGFLGQPGLGDLDEGKYEIAGDRVFAIVARENGRQVSDAELEGHRKYIDVQYIISGNESMGWKAREGLVNSVDYDDEKDLEFFEGEPDSIAQIPAGSFAVFFPTDAHLPLIGDGPIHKVIVKVAVG
jgi:YhcH/YjgK/YiaL family protein